MNIKNYGIPCIDRAVKPEERSEHYGFVSTAAVLTALENGGWEVKGVQLPRKKTNDPSVAKHLVTLTHPALTGTLSDGLIPTLNVLNSHNTSSSLQLRLGIYRLVCTNGLMIGEDWAGFKVIHRDSLVRDVTERVAELVERVPLMAADVSRMSQVELTPERARELIIKIIQLRYKGVNESDIQGSTMRPRRTDDFKRDLFTVFNRAQELLIRGGVRYLKTDAEGYRNWATTRKVGQVGDILTLNKEAYNVAKTYLNEAA